MRRGALMAKIASGEAALYFAFLGAEQPVNNQPKLWMSLWLLCTGTGTTFGKG